MRKKIIAGNWKMNKTPMEALELVEQIKDKCNVSECDVVFCVPFIDLISVIEKVKDTNISVGAQNMYFEDNGAYTGEISPKMLKESGVKYVILGHSERRQYFCETDETVNKKVKKAIEYGLIPIICVGETLEQREKGVTVDFINVQVKSALYNVSKEDAENIVIAYEPIWAIGTGKTATNAQAQEVCAEIRKTLSSIYDNETADKMRIQYGGSVNEKNAKDLFAMGDIDGGLVGGASLKAEFIDIVKSI